MPLKISARKITKFCYTTKKSNKDKEESSKFPWLCNRQIVPSDSVITFQCAYCQGVSRGRDEKEDSSRKGKRSQRSKSWTPALKKCSYYWKSYSLQMTWGAPDLLFLTGCSEKFASVLQVRVCLDWCSLSVAICSICRSSSVHQAMMLFWIWICQNNVFLIAINLIVRTLITWEFFVRNVTVTDA